jgi:Flp pilus assembly pilin Flp
MSPPRGSSRLTDYVLRLAMLIQRGAADRSGATAIQYALIAAGIGAVVAATVYSVGTTTESLTPTFSKLF